jgi:SHS2 domain-containing protein
LSFRIIEDIVSGDYVFQAFGSTLEEMFVSCAEACFSAMTVLSGVEPGDRFPIDIDADNIDDLLFNFLAELIYLKDTEKLFLSKFDIDIDADRVSLKGVARGERIDYNKHEIKTDVKAVTYHNLQVIKTGEGYEVKVILDL